MKIKNRVIALLLAGTFALQVGGCNISDMLGGLMGA